MSSLCKYLFSSLEETRVPCPVILHVLAGLLAFLPSFIHLVLPSPCSMPAILGIGDAVEAALIWSLTSWR